MQNGLITHATESSRNRERQADFMIAELYNKNTRVMSVELENAQIVKLGEIYNRDELPLYLCRELNLEKINTWLDKRKMPVRREGLKNAKMLLGSAPFQNYIHMFSLTDQYWFKTKKTDSWESMNFFTNEYPSDIGQALFTPWDINTDNIRRETPDLTTNGVLRKVWIQNKATKKSYLVKAGSKCFAQEPISEILASVTLKKISIIPFVQYKIAVNGMRICSVCENFVDEHTEFVPAQSIYNLEPRLNTMSKFDHLVLMCTKYGLPDPKDYLYRMILADLITGNNDRHLGNFGALHNVDTHTVEGFVPLFDFGSAFYEYSKERKEISDIFKSETQNVVDLYGCIPSLKKLKDTSDLMRLIDTYPDLTVSQKDDIKTGIEKRFSYFSNL